MPDISTKYYHVRSRLKGLHRDMAWQLGLNKLLVKRTGSRILVYHGICLSQPLQFNTLFITRSSFEAQLRFYKKHFNIVSLEDYYEQRFSKEKFNTCLVFDDGFANNHKYVLPLLEQYQVPAAFFITGVREAGYDILWNDLLSLAYKCGPQRFSFEGEDFVKSRDNKYVSSSTNRRLVDILTPSGFRQKAEMMKILDPHISYRDKVNEDFWLQLTVKQIQQLSASKWVTIGSHGYYHNDLGKIPLADAKDEILGSKQWLEKVSGKEIKAIAFPYGSYSKEVVSAAKNAGFSQLLGTEFHFPDDINDATMRERLTINPFISTINQVYANTSGNYK